MSRNLKRKSRVTSPYSPASYSLASTRPSKKPRIASYQRGYIRRAGYYGRFSQPGGEWKFFDTSSSPGAISSTAQIVEDSINEVVQGVKENERIGRKCVIRSINFRYQVTLPEKNDEASPVAGDLIRVVMYVDKQANGATAAGSDILQTNTNIQSFNNLSNSNRFRILYDKVHQINYTTLAADALNNFEHAEVVQHHAFYKKCNIPIEFNSTTGAITEIRSNNVGIMCISKNGIATFLGNTRIRFSDS